MQGGGEVEGAPLFMACPSFREEASAAPSPEYATADDSDEDGDFEFAFVIQDPEIAPGLSADEIFCNGQIRTVYPVFNRALLFANDDGYGDGYGDRLAPAPAPAEEEGEEKTGMIRGTLRRLMMEDRGYNPGSASSSSSSSATDELDGISPATYCVWAPNPSASPSRCRKSRSTGSSLRWRLRDLVVGRSHSDGKEKFVFLAAEDKTKTKTKTRAKENDTPSRESTPAAAAEKPKKEARAKATNATALDVVTAHRVYYGKAGPVGGSPAAARRSFLPYKQDLVGLFASVNAVTRTHHPF